MNFIEDAKTVEMGCETVNIEKRYGPLVFCDIRVTADADECKWIIERKRLLPDENGDMVVISWEKMSKFDGQESLNMEV